MKDTHCNNSYVELQLQIQICNLYLENKGFGTTMRWSLAFQAEIASVRIRHDALEKEKRGKI